MSSKDEEIRHIQIRRKNLLYLIQRYLNDNGFYNTASALKLEAKLSDEFELCDNIDLDGIYLEYASYYQLKFGKYPRILKKVQAQANNNNVKLELAANKRKKTKQQTVENGQANKEGGGAGGDGNLNTAIVDVNDLQVTVKKMETPAKPEQSLQRSQQPSIQLAKVHSPDMDTMDVATNKETLKRLHDIEHDCTMARNDLLLNSQEWQSLAELAKSCIIKENSKLKWSDICGNLEAVEVIKEAVLLPLQFPQLFANGLKPWKSVLIHGPPGSGKTLLAKVLYAESRLKEVTFFHITSSIIVSKWRGESEKLLKALFHVAQKYSPSIVFFDEIEGLTSKRDRCSDHESSKRFKNELLQLMDGLEQTSQGVFILASTNLPWEIDGAFLRRFEKKLLVQLPNEAERSILISKLLPLNVKLTEQQKSSLVRLSEGFTGDEIRLACKEIAMQAIRKITKATLKSEKLNEEIQIEAAFRQIKPLGLAIMEKHINWQKENGT